jgi:hypothetical protein
MRNKVVPKDRESKTPPHSKTPVEQYLVLTSWERYSTSYSRVVVCYLRTFNDAPKIMHDDGWMKPRNDELT